MSYTLQQRRLTANTAKQVTVTRLLDEPQKTHTEDRHWTDRITTVIDPKRD